MVMPIETNLHVIDNNVTQKKSLLPRNDVTNHTIFDCYHVTFHRYLRTQAAHFYKFINEL